MIKAIWSLPLGLLLISCSSGTEKNSGTSVDPSEPRSEGEEEVFFYGADLSYVNEMEDCGAVYYNEEDEQLDAFRIFADAGANLVRLRLWHDPSWGSYSNFSDVRKAISRARATDQKVLLDFHYSDTWADPERQLIPKAWRTHVDDVEVLGDSVYQYTFKTLEKLGEKGLLPAMVQVGNETNAMILQDEMEEGPIDWSRNAYLFNKGIKAVRDISAAYEQEIGIMLHIAQPENALWWFRDAVENGITDFDWLGISYYPLWSEYPLEDLDTAIKALKASYNKKIMVVETAYPFTLENFDNANNILDEEALLPGYPATPKGQYDYLVGLAEIIKASGGSGLVYWEPAWVSTTCNTQWGQGSHWDNATMFDQDGKAHEGIRFFSGAKKE
ncbi:glycoside hydrolase family 53 protein [Zeaxanthinibacter enoshimensis]|uniref:Arabinogalactan endo-beta-1,4-galactanase n=1 Tax=Zeaxanthinibacter enoshimensis TaxID=392009 RepID=A0A4R6TJX3_9FLAO|nr:arabinogalactan endo-1,4-beta-galactosidase [Zeaxanthinibacter enoshimensis]TDQ30917.1 arabinogalactan endo-1,4-beta-galactosidase [Zeaxanthinibacter enoshimensis]